MSAESNIESYVLAVDLGTSGPKVAVVSVHGEIMGQGYCENDVEVLPGGGAEQSPEKWWQLVVEASRQAILNSKLDRDKIQAVAVTGQWSGTVAVDESGRPLAKALIWMDSRGAEAASEISKGWLNVEGYGLTKLLKWVRLTGGVPSQSGKDSLAHILFLKKSRPQVYQKTYKFLEPKDYLNFCFTGKMATSAETTTLHWLTDNRDPWNICYSDELFKMAGLSRHQFPEIMKPTEILGTVLPEVAEQVGLSPNTKVILGTPDIHAASVGSGAVEDFHCHLYIGTSSWLTCQCPTKELAFPAIWLHCPRPFRVNTSWPMNRKLRGSA